MHLRARYGHGGRLGYDREWRAQPARSGGGELIDQGMHLLDLTHWIAGPLPLHSALLRTHFWDTEVEDNAALILGAADERSRAVGDAPRDLDRVEEHVLDRGLLPDGEAAGRRPGALLRDPEAADLPHAPELGPPDLEERTFPDEDVSWTAEWEHLAAAIGSGEPVLGGLEDAHYALVQGAGRLRRFAGVRGVSRRADDVARWSVDDAAAADLHPRRRSRARGLGEHVRDTPKPLLEVAGEPFLLHQLRLLARARRGASRALRRLSRRTDRATRSAASSSASRSTTATTRRSWTGPSAPFAARLPLLGDRFLVLYGDTYLRLDYRAAVRGGSRAMLRR